MYAVLLRSGAVARKKAFLFLVKHPKWLICVDESGVCSISGDLIFGSKPPTFFAALAWIAIGKITCLDIVIESDKC